MSDSTRLEYQEILEGFKDRFVVDSIYNGIPQIAFKVISRPLSGKEKKDIINIFLDVFMINFFTTKGRRVLPSFLGGNMKFVKEEVGGQYAPVIKWISNRRGEVATIKLSFENVRSELILNLVSEYKKTHDMGLLEDL